MRHYIFELTCCGCPEQYDIWDKDKNIKVAYARFRWGYLQVHPYKPEKYLKVKNPLENTKLLYENKFIDQKNGGISTPKRSRHVEENYDDSDYEPNWVEAF